MHLVYHPLNNPRLLKLDQSVELKQAPPLPGGSKGKQQNIIPLS